MAKLPTVRMHPPALLSPFQHISGAAHPSLMPAGVASDIADTENGKALGMRDAARARRGENVVIPAFVDTAGFYYKRGYLHGLVVDAGMGGRMIIIVRGGTKYFWPFSEKLSWAGALVRLANP